MFEEWRVALDEAEEAALGIICKSCYSNSVKRGLEKVTKRRRIEGAVHHPAKRMAVAVKNRLAKNPILKSAFGSQIELELKLGMIVKDITETLREQLVEEHKNLQVD